MSLIDDWTSEECDPVADIKAAIKKMSEPDLNYWKRRGEQERMVEWATNELIKSGMSPEQVANLYVKYGIWPEVL